MDENNSDLTNEQLYRSVQIKIVPTQQKAISEKGVSSMASSFNVKFTLIKKKVISKK